MKPEDIEIKIKKDETASSSPDAATGDSNTTTPSIPEDSNSILEHAMKEMEETKKLQEIKQQIKKEKKEEAKAEAKKDAILKLLKPKKKDKPKD